MRVMFRLGPWSEPSTHTQAGCKLFACLETVETASTCLHHQCLDSLGERGPKYVLSGAQFRRWTLRHYYCPHYQHCHNTFYNCSDCIICSFSFITCLKTKPHEMILLNWDPFILYTNLKFSYCILTLVSISTQSSKTGSFGIVYFPLSDGDKLEI